LWKKVLELKKLRLRAAKGAKTDSSKRGHFLTYGCETAAEVLFAAATLYNLALFLHFPHLVPSWNSLFNAGTRATERMISELQGKTNQIQSLNSQPTFGDMLNRVSAVQVNQSVEKQLASKGVKIAPSSKRRKENYNVQTHSAKGTKITFILPHLKRFEENSNMRTMRVLKKPKLFSKRMLQRWQLNA